MENPTKSAKGVEPVEDILQSITLVTAEDALGSMQKSWVSGSTDKMMNDILASALSNIFNAEKVGKEFCIVQPTSKIVKKVLEILQDNHYLGDIKYIENNKGGIFKVNLIGKINKVGVIKPRFSLQNDNFEKFEKRFLPAQDFGLLIISTSKGIMTHYEAKGNKIGGKLLAYCY